MSDPGLRVFVLDNGQRASVPADKIDKWMRRMDARGIGFKTEGAPVGEPETPPPAPAADSAPAPGTPPAEAPWYEVLGKGAERGARAVGQGAADFGRGLGQGITSRWGDELAARMTPEVDDGTGIPREYAAGSATADMTEQNRRDNREARERSPALYTGGEVIGAVDQAALPGAAAGKLGLAARAAGTARAVPLAASIAKNAIGGAGYGFAAGTGGSEASDPLDVLREGYSGAKTGALLGGGTTAVLGGVGKAASALAPKLMRGSNFMRGQAVGAPPDLGDAAESIGRQPGESAATAVGRKVEELGLPGASKGPMTGAGYARAADARADDLGTQLGIIIDRAAGPSGVGVPKAQVVDELLALRREYASGASDAARSKAAVVERAIKRLNAKPSETLDARDLQTLKSEFEASGGYRKGEAPPTPRISVAKEANRDVATTMRKNLTGAMDEQALREDVQPFHGARRGIGAARAIQSYASGAEGQSGMTRPLGRALLNFIPGGHALHAGLELGEDVAASGLKGAATGARKFGASMQAAAPVMGKIGSTSWAASHPDWLPPSRIAPPIEREQPPDDRAPLHDAISQYASNDDNATPERRTATARGQMLPDAAMRLYKQQPQAFGKWQRELFDARQQGEGQFAALLTRLQSNPEFQQTVLPKLQAMTAQK